MVPFQPLTGRVSEIPGRAAFFFQKKIGNGRAQHGPLVFHPKMKAALSSLSLTRKAERSLFHVMAVDPLTHLRVLQRGRGRVRFVRRRPGLAIESAVLSTT